MGLPPLYFYILGGVHFHIMLGVEQHLTAGGPPFCQCYIAGIWVPGFGYNNNTIHTIILISFLIWLYDVA